VGGRRTSKEELQQIEVLVEEGLTNREIARRLCRSEAGIRNLRYRKSLVKKAEGESKVLFQQRDWLKKIVGILKGQKKLLTNEVAGLRKEKLDSIINSDKNELQGVFGSSVEEPETEETGSIDSNRSRSNSLISSLIFWAFSTNNKYTCGA
jgi:hypothetical protein